MKNLKAKKVKAKKPTTCNHKKLIRELLDEQFGERCKLPGDAEDTFIVSNEVECLECHDRPFSAYKHDYKSCKCGAVSVDGGQSYLRRSLKKGKAMKELSINLSTYQVQACVDAVQWGIDNGRNQLGIALAVLRACRDTGIMKGF